MASGGGQRNTCGISHAEGRWPGKFFVLLKLLRERFQKGRDPKAPFYTSVEADGEYQSRMALYEARRSILKRDGPSWPCGLCLKSFPAEAFGVEPGSVQALQRLCVAAGHWRRCVACCQARDYDQSD